MGNDDYWQNGLKTENVDKHCPFMGGFFQGQRGDGEGEAG